MRIARTRPRDHNIYTLSSDALLSVQLGGTMYEGTRAKYQVNVQRQRDVIVEQY